jgi:hypothetical protein
MSSDDAFVQRVRELKMQKRRELEERFATAVRTARSGLGHGQDGWWILDNTVVGSKPFGFWGVLKQAVRDACDEWRLRLQPIVRDRLDSMDGTPIIQATAVMTLEWASETNPYGHGCTSDGKVVEFDRSRVLGRVGFVAEPQDVPADTLEKLTERLEHYNTSTSGS